MLRNVFLFVLFFVGITYSQEIGKNANSFTKFQHSLLLGTNAKTVPTLGKDIKFELGTNISSKVNLKISLGYSRLYNDAKYSIYSHSYFGYVGKFHTHRADVNKVKYDQFPILLGLEYYLLDSKLLFIEFNGGYNISSSEIEGTQHSFSELYDSVSDVPEIYRTKNEKLDNGSGVTLSFGLGLKYKIFGNKFFSVRYSYCYNETIINSHKILFGISI